MSITRRRLLVSGAVSAAGLAALPAESAESGKVKMRREADPWRGFKAGVASYTLRQMPLEQAIKAIQRVGLRYVSIKDFHLPLNSNAEQRRDVAAKFNAAGVTPLSCGNITM